MIPDFCRGTKLNNGEIVLEVQSSSNNFAILKLTELRTAIYIDSALYDELKKIDIPEGFLDYCFNKYSDGYYYLSKPEYKIFSAKNGPYAESEEEVFNLCSTFRAFFSEHKNLALSDILYIEEYNILLPVLDGDAMSTNTLIGAWICEGLPIDAADIDKVCFANQWLSQETIEKAVVAAGIEPIKNNKQEKEKDIVKEEVLTNKSPKIEGKFLLPGRTKLTQYFNDQIVDFIKNVDKYERMGIHSVPATLLYGKPGCGKTYAVEKLAEFLNLPCFEINSSTVASPYIHDTSKKIAEVFAKAIDAAPSILIIDEIESYVSTRENSGTGTHHIEEVDEFLRNIPKAIEAKVIIFGMTNMIDLIDPAVLRKGRFDYIEEVGMPSKEEVVAVLSAGLEEVPCDSDIDINALAEKLLERPMSDVSFIIRQGARIAVKNDCEKVKQSHLLEAVVGLSPVKKASNPRKIGF